jgi:hypothetical protein
MKIDKKDEEMEEKVWKVKSKIEEFVKGRNMQVDLTKHRVVYNPKF